MPHEIDAVSSGLDLSANVDDFARWGDQGTALLGRLAAATNLPSSERELRLFRRSEAMEIGGLTEWMWRSWREAQPDSPASDEGRISLAELHRLQEEHGRRPSRPEGTRPISMAVVNFKGGAAKSSSSLHLSHYLAFRGWRVLVIDMDPQGTLSRYLGVAPDQIDPKDTMTVAFPDADGVASVPSPRATHIDGLDLVPASLDMMGSDISIAAAFMRRDSGARNFYRCLSDAIAAIEEPYDIVLIDTAPAFSFTALNCLWAASALLIPVPTGGPDLSATLDFTAMSAEILRSIEQASGERKRYNPTLVVHSRVVQGPVSEEIRAMTQSVYGAHRIDQSVPDSRAVVNAMALLRSVYEATSDDVDSRSLRRARDAYDQVGARVVEALQRAWDQELEQNAKEAS